MLIRHSSRYLDFAANGAVDTDAITFYRLGLAVYSMNFMAPVPNWATFQAMMTEGQRFGAFSPEQLVATAKPLVDEADYVMIGMAESTPSLEFVIACCVNAQIGHGKQQCNPGSYPLERRVDYAQRILDWAKTMGADATSVEQDKIPGVDLDFAPDWTTGDHPRCVGLWWFEGGDEDAQLD